MNFHYRFIPSFVSFKLLTYILLANLMGTWIKTFKTRAFIWYNLKLHKLKFDSQVGQKFEQPICYSTKY